MMFCVLTSFRTAPPLMPSYMAFGQTCATHEKSSGKSQMEPSVVSRPAPGRHGVGEEESARRLRGDASLGDAPLKSCRQR